MPAEAVAVRKAAHAILNGATLHSIAKQWNAQGIKTTKGYAWEGSKVHNGFQPLPIIKAGANVGGGTVHGQ